MHPLVYRWQLQQLQTQVAANARRTAYHSNDACPGQQFDLSSTSSVPPGTYKLLSIDLASLVPTSLGIT